MNNNSSSPFILTREYLKFVEFCDSCKRNKYIGLCYGAPGVGKTLSARYYSQWDSVENLYPYVQPDRNKLFLALQDFNLSRTIYYTSPVCATSSRIEKEIYSYANRAGNLLRVGLPLKDRFYDKYSYNDISNCAYTRLIIIDEAERLKTHGLEQIRDVYDKLQVGVVLIGMPGIEKRLSRYPQLYSRVGFVHNYNQLKKEEIENIVKNNLRNIGVIFETSEDIDKESISEIVRITRGNFRLLNRLFTQVQRVMEINKLNLITKEVIEVARENLIIGSI